MPLTTDINFPEKPEVVSESDQKGRYRIGGLYPGYGYTLGNSLRRIILSSLPGAAITSVQIDGVSHEFGTIDGVKEDVITILMNLKNVRFSVSTDETQTATLSAEGKGEVTAGDIDTPGQMDLANPDQRIATITADATEPGMEFTIETGLGYVTKEEVKEDKLSAGEMALDADFSPIRRVNYEVEDMRVGNRTDFNRLEMIIETDGTIDPRDALEDSIEIMIRQLQSVIDLEDEPVDGPQLDVHEQTDEPNEDEGQESDSESDDAGDDEDISEFRKTRVEKLDLPTRTKNALERASIRTVGGLMQKTRDDLLDVDGLGAKGVDEIEDVLEDNEVSLKDS